MLATSQEYVPVVSQIELTRVIYGGGGMWEEGLRTRAVLGLYVSMTCAIWENSLLSWDYETIYLHICHALRSVKY